MVREAHWLKLFTKFMKLVSEVRKASLGNLSRLHCCEPLAVLRNSVFFLPILYLWGFDCEFYHSTTWLDFWNPSYLTVQIFLNNLYNYLFNFAVLWSINPNCLYIISYTKHFLVVYTLKRLSLCPNWKVYKPVSAESFISVCQLDN